MSDNFGIALFPQHADALAGSGITPEHARARGYKSVDLKSRLEGLGIARAGRQIPGLLVPSLRVDGSIWGYQYRPDKPRLRNGKPVKYETPIGQHNGIDVPPGVGDQLDDPAVPLWVTEGSKKGDAGALAGLCIVALNGVWSWLGTNPKGGKVALPDWRDIALNDRRVILAFDGDVSRKRSVRHALDALADYLASKGAKVEYLHLPDADDKVGLDDYLAEHRVDELMRLVHPEPPPVTREPVDDDTADSAHPPNDSRSTTSAVTPVSLPDALAVFNSWLHIDDPAPVLIVAATIVANQAAGDPVWLLVVGPPSGGKTEVIQSCASIPEMVPAATITEAALLSGTQQRDRAKDATGGLLRQVGSFGILLAKDFTSVLAQNKDTAKAAMAALREVYDGSWHRPMGADGGRVLHWSGKAGFIGGVTPSYDRYGTIVTALGDRYLLLRMPDVDADAQARAALAQGDQEATMRAELAAAMTGLVAGAHLDRLHTALEDHEITWLVELATFAARARTAVERDGYSGDLLIRPQAEGPARLVKAMRRTYLALHAVGVDYKSRRAILTRVALDSAPAIRLPLIRVLAKSSTPRRTSSIATDVAMVTKTAARQLDDLLLLGIAERTKQSAANNSPDLWTATEWLRTYWPGEAGQITTTMREEQLKKGPSSQPSSQTRRGALRRSLSHSADDATTLCTSCGKTMAPALTAAGYAAHPSCGGTPA